MRDERSKKGFPQSVPQVSAGGFVFFLFCYITCHSLPNGFPLSPIRVGVVWAFSVAFSFQFYSRHDFSLLEDRRGVCRFSFRSFARLGCLRCLLAYWQDTPSSRVVGGEGWDGKPSTKTGHIGNFVIALCAKWKCAASVWIRVLASLRFARRLLRAPTWFYERLTQGSILGS